MNFRTTAILVGLLVVVLLICWAGSIFGPPRQGVTETDTPTAAQGEKLFEPPLGNINKVRIDRAGKGFMEFEKQDADWRVVKPVDAPAARWAVRQLVDMASQLKQLQKFMPGRGEHADLDLAKLGLVEPTIKVTYWTGQKQVKLLVGNNVIMSENTYVMFEGGENVYVVDKNIRQQVKKDLNDYRDKQLWKIKTDQVDRLEIQQAGVAKVTKVVVVKSDGKWVLDSPIRATADDDKIGDAVNGLAYLKVSEFIDDTPENLARYGLDTPAMTVEFSTSEKIGKDKPLETQPTSAPVRKQLKTTSYVLYVGSAAGLDGQNVYAKLADKRWVFAINRDDLKKFTPDMVAWRNKKVFAEDTDQITRIECIGRSEHFTLIREDQGPWSLGVPMLGQVDQERVKQLLDTLSGLEAVDFLDDPSDGLKDEGLDDPVCRIKLYMSGKVEPVVLTIGGLTGSKLYRYVQRDGRQYVSVVKQAQAEKLLGPAYAYRDRQMLKLVPADVREVRLTRGRREYVLQRGDDRLWRVVKPIEADAEQAAVMTLVATLADLKAQDYVSDGKLSTYGLDKPQIVAVITTKRRLPTTTTATSQPQEPKTIIETHKVIFSRQGDGLYAAVSPGRLVARLDDSVVDDLDKEFVDTRIFRTLAKGQVDRVTITRGQDSFTLAVTDGKWSYPDDPVFQVDQSEIQKLIDAVGKLKARQYVQFNDKNLKQHNLDKPKLTVELYSGRRRLAGLDISGEHAIATGAANRWVFAIADQDIEKLNKQLKDFAKK